MIKLIAILLVNVLTAMRIVGVFCLLPIFYRHGGVAAAILSILCYFTDCLDGIIARKAKVSTFFGSVFDGVADKAFSVANLILLFTITKYAIIPILCEIAIITVQTIKYQRNENVQSSKAGKLKTWVIGLTVILLYFVIDINKLTFLSTDFINYILSLDPAKLFGIMFIPLYIFEFLTLFLYLKFLGEKHPALEIPKIDIKLKPVKCFKDRWDNFCTLWLNHEFYEKYKDSAGLKEIKKQIKKTQLS